MAVFALIEAVKGRGASVPPTDDDCSRCTVVDAKLVAVDISHSALSLRAAISG
jgi:hypothetical protein